MRIVQDQIFDVIFSSAFCSYKPEVLLVSEGFMMREKLYKLQSK